jgi:hypothetical protein
MTTRSNILPAAIVGLLITRAPKWAQRMLGYMLLGAILTVVLIVFSVMAHAGDVLFYSRAGVAKPNQLPKFFLGTWCGGFLTNNPEEQIAVLGPENYPVDGRTCDNELEMAFAQKAVAIRYLDPKVHDATTCEYRSIKTWFDKTITATTKTTGVVVSRIVAQCEGKAGSHWNVVFRKVYISKGSLWVEW